MPARPSAFSRWPELVDLGLLNRPYLPLMKCSYPSWKHFGLLLKPPHLQPHIDPGQPSGLVRPKLSAKMKINNRFPFDFTASLISGCCTSFKAVELNNSCHFMIFLNIQRLIGSIHIPWMWKSGTNEGLCKRLEVPE